MNHYLSGKYTKFTNFLYLTSPPSLRLDGGLPVLIHSHQFQAHPEPINMRKIKKRQHVSDVTYAERSKTRQSECGLPD